MSRAAARMLTPSERDWLTVRGYLAEHRYELAVDAAEDYPPGRGLADTPLLAAPGWLPAAPVPLQDITLELLTQPAAPHAEAEAAARRCSRSAATGPGTPATPTRWRSWPPRRCSRTGSPTG